MASNVPFLDLTEQYRSIRGEIAEALTRLFESQRFILGEEVAGLEKEVAARCGTAHAIGVASGTDALILSIRALELASDAEIVTSPFSFIATAGAVVNAGAKPTFADIDPETLNLDPDSLEAHLTPRTRAVMPVHLFGQCADMTRIGKVAERAGLRVIEDAAQSFGAAHRGRGAGSMGTAGCLSFFPTKNLGGFGDGGMIVTQDGGLAERSRAQRVHGGLERDLYRMIGTNSRLDTLQAAVLLVKLHYLDRWTEARRENARYYNEAFADCPEVRTPRLGDGNDHVYNQYTIRVELRDRLAAYLRERGIGSMIYYSQPIHLQPCFESLGYREGDFPEAERAAHEVVSLPIFPELGAERRERVAAAVRAFFGR